MEGLWGYGAGKGVRLEGGGGGGGGRERILSPYLAKLAKQEHAPIHPRRQQHPQRTHTPTPAPSGFYSLSPPGFSGETSYVKSTLRVFILFREEHQSQHLHRLSVGLA